MKLILCCLRGFDYRWTEKLTIRQCIDDCTVRGFTTSTHFDDSIAGLTLERFMSLSKSKYELKEA